MKVIRLVLMIALAMALTVTLITMKKGNDHAQKEPLLENDTSEYSDHAQKTINIPTKRISRFLQAANDPRPKNHRSSDHCRKHKDICQLAMPLNGRNSTCCHNKCVDLHYDSYNCGACKRKCLPFESCCRGECVNLSFDKRHCGFCNNRCLPGARSKGICIYGTCDYA